ncbi:MAG: PH domain-containing protein [Planctomycetota bacterium]
MSDAPAGSSPPSQASGAGVESPTQALDELPRDHTLDPRVVAYWRTKSTLGIVAIAIPSLISGSVTEFFASSLPAGWILGALGLAVMLALLTAFTWPGLAYRRTSFHVDDDGLEIRSGVLWRQIHHVPRNRVQHTEVNQGPLERYFGLAHLIVHTAGTTQAAIPLHGLTPDAAQNLRLTLARRSASDAV